MPENLRERNNPEQERRQITFITLLFTSQAYTFILHEILLFVLRLKLVLKQLSYYRHWDVSRGEIN